MQFLASRGGIDLDFALSTDRDAFHERALAHLFREIASHPLLADRLDLEAVLSGVSTLDMLARVEPRSTEDHRHAILRAGRYAQAFTPQMGSPIVFSTGGSTGAPKLLVNTYEETLMNAVHHGRGYWFAGIRPHHRVATFGGSGTYASEYCVYHALSQTHCTIVPINDFRNTESNLDILRELEVGVLLVMPSELFAMVDTLETRKERLDKVSLVVTGGEPVSAQLRARLREVLSPNVRFGSTFQTADVGTIGYQCPFCSANEYHLHEQLQFAEILDVDGIQQLSITNLNRRYMPVVRILTGDRATWQCEERSCGCGRSARKLALQGRTSDLLKIGGEKISADHLREMPMALGIPEHLIRIEVDCSEKGKDRITILSDFVIKNGAEATVETYLRSEIKLRQMMDEDRCERLRFAGSPPRDMSNGGSGKYRLIFDLRAPEVAA